VARITHKYHENDYKAANYIGARAREIMEAAGAIKTWALAAWAMIPASPC